MKYNSKGFNHFSITTELKSGVVDYWENNKIREYVNDALTEGVDLINSKYNDCFKWYIELEDRTTVFLEICDCANVNVIKELEKLIADKFGESNIFIYFDANSDEIMGDCISDMDEDFNFNLLDN